VVLAFKASCFVQADIHQLAQATILCFTRKLVQGSDAFSKSTPGKFGRKVVLT